MATIAVKDATGATQNLEVPLTTGAKTSALSRPVVLASDQAAVPVSGFQLGAGAATGTTTRVAIISDQTAIPVSGFQLGAGASTGTTTRVTIDTGQLGALVAGAVPVVSGGYEYQTVAASATGTVLQVSAGATGDYLESILCVVATAATSQVMIGDGAAPAVVILPNAVGAGVGTYPIPLGLTSKTGSWRVTTAAGVSIIATGNFS